MALFDGAENMIPQIPGMLNDYNRVSFVILYAPSTIRPFSALMRQADHIIEIVPADDTIRNALYRRSRSLRNGQNPLYAQRIVLYKLVNRNMKQNMPKLKFPISFSSASPLVLLIN